MQVSVRAQGLQALTRELMALGVDLEDIKDAMAEIAARGAKVAAKYAPVGSGRDPHPGQLRADIRGNRARAKAVVTAGRVSVPYAGPINYSWPARNIKGSFFMQKVDTELGPLAPTILQLSISNLIRKRGLG